MRQSWSSDAVRFECLLCGVTYGPEITDDFPLYLPYMPEVVLYTVKVYSKIPS